MAISVSDYAALETSISPREIRSKSHWQPRSDIQVRFQFDPKSQYLGASITHGEIVHTIPREAIEGVPDGYNPSQVYQFIQHAICVCSDADDAVILMDPNRFFIEQLTLEKIGELEKSSSSIEETIQTQNGPQFIYEFIQNACDAAKENQELDVSFVLHEDALVISHSGKPFEESNVKTICKNQDMNNLKRQDAGCIGYKGAGFKSIFNHTDTVTILSDFSFRFDKHADEWKDRPQLQWELCPLYTPPSPLIEKYGLDSSRVNFVIQLNRPDNRVRKHLEDFFSQKAPEAFFFLALLSKLQFEDKKSPGSRVILQKEHQLMARGPDEPPSGEDASDVETETYRLSKNGAPLGSWLRYTKNISLPGEIKAKLKTADRIPDRYREMEDPPISFILPLQDDNQGKKIRASLYCYLPMTLSLGLPIPINARFFLDLSRQSLQKDHFFNEFLFAAVGENLFHFYAYVAQHYPENVFPILEIPSQLTFDANPETYRTFFNKSADKAMLSIAFLPSREKVLLRSKGAMIDELGFAQKFESQIVKKQMLLKCHSQYFPILEKMGVTRYGWAKIVARIRLEKFIKWVAANPQKALELLRYFKALFDAGQQTKEIKQLPFLLSHYPPDSKDLLFNPRNIYFPHHPPIEGLDFVKVPLLHPVIRENLTEEETKWLKEKLGVTTASLSIYVDRINQAESESLTAHVVGILFAMFASGKPVPSEFQRLKLPVLLNKEKKVFASPSECYLPDILQPKHALQRNIVPKYGYYLSEALYNPITQENRGSFGRFLCSLGVVDRVSQDNVHRLADSLSSPEEMMSFIRFLYQHLFLSPESESEFLECAKLLQGKSIFLTVKSQLKRPTECFLPSVYLPQMDLFSASERVRKHLHFVSEDYFHDAADAKTWKKFFLSLGVRERLDVQQIDGMTADKFVDKLKKEAELIKWRSQSITDPQFNYIEFLWRKTDYPPSKVCTSGGHPVPFSTLSCAVTNQDRYRYQHTLSTVLWIEYAFLIKGTHLFWQLMRTHWEDKIERYLGESLTYRTHCSVREQGVPTMLEFYTQNAVETDSGEYYSPQDVYAPALRWLVHPILPVPKADFPLTEAQVKSLKFKTQISVSDCISLLRALQENPSDSNNEKKIAAIYSHLAQAPEQVCEIPDDLQLMAEDGSFKNPKLLFGNCVKGISFKHSSMHLLKRSSGLSLEDFSIICRRLGVHMIQSEALQVEAAEKKIDENFKQKVISRLPFVFGSTQNEGVLQALEMCARQIHNLQFITASEITLTFQLGDINLREPVFAYFQGQYMYGKESFSHSRTLGETADYLCSAFEIPCGSGELVHLLNAADEKILEDFVYQGNEEQYEEAQRLALEIEERVKIPLVVAREEKEIEDAMDIDEKPSIPPPQSLNISVSPIRQAPPAVQKTKRTSSFGYPSSKRFAAASPNDSKPHSVAKENYPRRAEERVFNYFVKKYGSEDINGAVIKTYSDPKLLWDRKIVRWINCYSEAYMNHDFQIDYMKGDALVRTKYLEVKSKDPVSQHLGIVTLSDEERSLMEKSGENYSIWIVKFLGEEEPRLYKISHPQKHIQSGTIKAEPITKPAQRLTIPEESMVTKKYS